MADKKITELTGYTPPIDTDVLPIVDVTTSTTKKITWANIKANMPSQVEDSVTDGHTTVAPSGNAVYDALALKAPLISPSFTTPALGAPTSGNLANCTFPTLNQNTTGTAANLSGTPDLPNGTTATTQSANDNSTKLATTAYADALKSAALTVTNKRNQKRVYSTTSLATLTPEIDTYDIFCLTAQAAALSIANHSTSTPANGEMILIRILDNGTARAISFGTNYVAKAGVALPTTTTLSKNMCMLFIWDSNLSKYNLLSVGQEA